MQSNDIDIVGRKTFFIAVESDMLPDSQLEDFLSHGYECYLVNDDDFFPLRKKIDVLAESFPGSIFFFNIDARIPNITWEPYVKEFQKKHEEDALVGIVYTKRESPSENTRIENYYVWQARLRAGCIGIQPKSKSHFEAIERVLFETKANGRRKTARATCDNNSFVTFGYKKRRYRARVVDINISHISCIMDDKEAVVPIYEKMQNLALNINGMVFNADAVMIIHREKGGVLTCVCMFIHTDGTPGLEPATHAKLKRKIYQIVSEQGMESLRALFNQARTATR